MLPEELKRLLIRLRFRGQTIELEEVSQELVRLRAISPETEMIRLSVGSEVFSLSTGKPHEFKCKGKPVFMEAP